MKNLRMLNHCRDTKRELALYGAVGDGGNGVFRVSCPATGGDLWVIASNGLGWDHVSVSLNNRIPNWTEMEFVKRMFFKDDEPAMQLHVPTAEHISFATNALHLWRPHRGLIPMPPSYMVGPKAAE